MKSTILIFSAICVALLLLFQLSHWSLLSMGGSDKPLLIIFGLLFLVLGILTGRYFYFKKEEIKKVKKQSLLSEQELKVLQLISEGLSNKEIAEKLFIAETTVKSHVSNILSKLDAKRRTEAVKLGRQLDIIT